MATASTFNEVTWQAYIDRIETIEDLNKAVHMLRKAKTYERAAWRIISAKAGTLDCYYLGSAGEYRKNHHPSNPSTTNEQPT